MQTIRSQPSARTSPSWCRASEMPPTRKDARGNAESGPAGSVIVKSATRRVLLRQGCRLLERRGRGAKHRTPVSGGGEFVQEGLHAADDARLPGCAFEGLVGEYHERFRMEA